MKPLLLSLSLVTAVLLPSCEVMDMDPGYSPRSYYGGGGYASAPGYYSPTSYSSGYYNTDYYDYGYAGRPYDGGYYRAGRYYNRSGVYCPPENYHHDGGHSSYSSHSSDNHSSSSFKLIRGNDGDHPNRPGGYHTREWYEHRGYDLSDYAHKHKDGEVHKGDDKDKRHSH